MALSTGRSPRSQKPVHTSARSRKLPLAVLRMVPALFALLFTAGMFVGAISGVFRPEAADFGKCYAAAREAGEWKEAVIWLKRQLAADPAALEARMNLIEAYVSLGEIRVVADLLNHIAPVDRVVYGPAHLYRANLLTAGGVGNPEVRSRARTSLELALRAAPTKGQGVVDQDAAHGLLGAVLSADGDWQGALVAIDKIARPSPANLVLRAATLKSLRRMPEATAAADAAVEEALAVDAGNTPEERLRRASIFARAALVKGEFNQAVEGVLAAGNEPFLEVLQATILRQALENLRSGGALNSVCWLDNVLRGLLALPHDMDLTTELIQGAALWSSQPGFTERTQRRLRESGLQAHLELLWGVAGIRKNQPGEAFKHFKMAWELLPGNPVLANNYAAMLGMSRNDLDRAAALDIIERVLERKPNMSSFLDTKGQILLRLGRVEEAVVVLEVAAKGAPDRATYAALAEAYTRLGKTELAESRRQLANPE